MLHPITEQEFNALAQQGYNRIPLVAETFADLDTPLSLYLKLANCPYSYLLESVQGGERFGRYSFIGLPADMRITVRGKQVTLTHNDVETTHEVDNPLDFIREYHARFKVAALPGLPRFCGGLAGYFGYDTIRYIEPRLAKTQKPDTIATPDILLMLTEQLAVVDNLSGKLTLIVYANPAQDDAYALASARLRELVGMLRLPVNIPHAPATHGGEAKSEFGETAFKDAVVKAKQYIFDGDIMQVVLSQRMAQPFPASPLSLYRALRSVNPSPYMFYYDMGDHHVVGASPEILVRLEHNTGEADSSQSQPHSDSSRTSGLRPTVSESRLSGATVTVRPIAGTRPRGKTQQQDAELAKELLADPKELAEHLMLIDLGRNDIGRVAQNGTVKLTEKMIIERYSHVMHIVSNVEATLKPGLSAMDVLKATFPAGTVSGAAKVRAMEIIDELEPTKRGIYAGAVGYLGFNGDMDLAIALRTAVVKDNMLYVQAGAGIVADSVPDSEWTETQNKARAVLRAAEMVLEGLDAEVHR
ncbi:MAG: anthranilate synthase component I [Nitrosomonadales bacterium]|nr:anthranilate synthase component I [Nitrosomonadales bacterium]